MPGTLPDVANTGNPRPWMGEWGEDEFGPFATVFIFGDEWRLRWIGAALWRVNGKRQLITAGIWITEQPMTEQDIDGIGDVAGWMEQEGPEGFTCRPANVGELVVAGSLFMMGHAPGSTYITISDAPSR